MSDTPPHSLPNESLSALMDGEAKDFELRRLMQQLPSDSAMRAKWARYQLAASILHKQTSSSVLSLEFANAVQAAIQQDFLVEKHTVAAWKKFAVAASVALAVVTGVQWQQRAVVTSQQAVATTHGVSHNHLEPALLESVASIPLLAGQPARGAYAERYLQNNLERAALDEGKSKVPLAPAAVKINHKQ